MVGANLECILAYEKIAPEWIYLIIDFCHDYDLSITEEKSLLIYGADFIVPWISTSRQGVDELVKRSFSFEGFRSVRINLSSSFCDVDVNFSFVVDLDIGVITISVDGEAFIWNYTNGVQNAKLERLQAFAAICKAFCRQFQPKYAFLQDESFSSQDFTVDLLDKNCENEYLYTNDFLSKEYIQRVFEYYVG